MCTLVLRTWPRLIAVWALWWSKIEWLNSRNHWRDIWSSSTLLLQTSWLCELVMGTKCKPHCSFKTGLEISYKSYFVTGNLRKHVFMYTWRCVLNQRRARLFIEDSISWQHLQGLAYCQKWRWGQFRAGVADHHLCSLWSWWYSWSSLVASSCSYKQTSSENLEFKLQCDFRKQPQIRIPGDWSRTDSLLAVGDAMDRCNKSGESTFIHMQLQLPHYLTKKLSTSVHKVTRHTDHHKE